MLKLGEYMQANVQQQEQQLRARILTMLEKPPTQPGSLSAPKEDKILEWTLFKIYEQMQQINENIASIARKIK
jgi:hypothetical protein